MEKVYRVIIIGAGASGLMVAANLNNKRDVLVLESNKKPGVKISISGGGKCNLTNRFVGVSNYIGDSRFVSRAFKGVDRLELLDWFLNRGVELEERDFGQLFCIDSAHSVIAALMNECKGVEFGYECEIDSVSRDDGLFVVTNKRGSFVTERLVVASGGLSYAKIGASGIGYDIAKYFGHSVVTLAPGLVGLTLQKKHSFFKEFSGVSLDVKVKVAKKSMRGSLLFTHSGISGPVVLDASLYWHGGEIIIDFLPEFELSSMSGKSSLLSNLLPMPKRVVKRFLQELGVNDRSAKETSSHDMIKLEKLKEYRVAPSGNFGYSKAEVTRGGVLTKDINQNSMMSKLVKQLYFVGEVLDVTGELGGYNFQWAFTSGHLCAKSINMEKE